MAMTRMNAVTRLLAVVLLVLTSSIVLAMGNGSKNDHRISVDRLYKMLDSPNLVVIDVRDPISWEKSDRKIRGAIREDPQNVKAWAGKYDKEKTIVLYCA